MIGKYQLDEQVTAAAIRNLRKLRNMTVPELAEKTGMSTQQLTVRLKGHLEFKLSEAIALCDAMRVSLAGLMSEYHYERLKKEDTFLLRGARNDKQVQLLKDELSWAVKNAKRQLDV